MSAPRSGVVSWVLAASSDVAEGDEIVKLVGFERADNVVDRHNKSLASYEIRLVAAEGKSAGRIAEIESNVARKKLDIQLANEKRDAFIVRAPIAGVVDARVEAGGRIKAGDVVANVTGAASATVKFTLPAGATAGEGDTMEVVSKDDAELKATCTVTESEGQSVALSCPADSGLGDGANLQLQLP
ncbi:MAG: hypothetical protein GY811_25005 [Myxococcales bacterium]|nr:hypothetical protein [Myxococcales bacterium]